MYMYVGHNTELLQFISIVLQKEDIHQIKTLVYDM